jgi:hypothetical protein
MSATRRLTVNAATAEHAEVAVRREILRQRLPAFVTGSVPRPAGNLPDDRVAVVVTSDAPATRQTFAVIVTRTDVPADAGIGEPSPHAHDPRV